MRPRAAPDRVLVGEADIAAALRTSERQVRRWICRRVDPLRVRVYCAVPRILRSSVLAWQARHVGRAGLPRVLGWERIAARVEVSRFAAILASKRADDPLPVHHPVVGRVWAYASALDDWRTAQELAYGTWRRLRDALRAERASGGTDMGDEHGAPPDSPRRAA